MSARQLTCPLICRDANLRAELLSEGAEGQSLHDVAEACGVAYSSLREWLTAGKKLIKAQSEGHAPDSPDDVTLAEFAARFGRARARSVNAVVRSIHREVTTPSEGSRDIVYAGQVYLSMVRPATYSRAAQAKAALTGSDDDADIFADGAGITPAQADALLAAHKMARKVERDIEREQAGEPSNGNGTNGHGVKSNGASGNGKH